MRPFTPRSSTLDLKTMPSEIVSRAPSSIHSMSFSSSERRNAPSHLMVIFSAPSLHDMLPELREPVTLCRLSNRPAGGSGASGAKGAKGARGAKGAPGAKGADGAKGAGGASGASGANCGGGAGGGDGGGGAEGADGAGGAGGGGGGGIEPVAEPLRAEECGAFRIRLQRLRLERFDSAFSRAGLVKFVFVFESSPGVRRRICVWRRGRSAAAASAW